MSGAGMVTLPLVARLRCPQTRRELDEMTPAQLGRLNEAIEGGAVHDGHGQVVSEPVEAALVRGDRVWAYPMRHGVYLMNLHDRLLIETIEID